MYAHRKHKQPNYNPDSRFHNEFLFIFIASLTPFYVGISSPFSCSYKKNRQPQGRKRNNKIIIFVPFALFLCSSRGGNEHEEWMRNKSLVVSESCRTEMMLLAVEAIKFSFIRFLEKSWRESFCSAKSRYIHSHRRRNNESLMCTNDLIFKLNTIREKAFTAWTSSNFIFRLSKSLNCRIYSMSSSGECEATFFSSKVRCRGL